MIHLKRFLLGCIIVVSSLALAGIIGFSIYSIRNHILELFLAVACIAVIYGIGYGWEQSE